MKGDRKYYTNVGGGLSEVRSNSRWIQAQGFRLVVTPAGSLYVLGRECYSVSERAVQSYLERMERGEGTLQPRRMPGRSRPRVLPPTVHRLVRDQYVELRPGEEDLVAFMREVAG
jgi:hypothetical protein